MTLEPKSFAPEVVQVFNESNFYETFLADLANAKALVVLQSPFITHKRWSQLSSDFRSCVDRHVCVCVFVQDQGDSAEFQNCLLHLQNAGVHVNVRPSIHEKIAVIDERVLWDGSLNVLSHRNTCERMSRIVSREMAMNAMVEHRINQCDTCLVKRGRPAFAGGTATPNEQRQLLGLRIQQRRLDLRMTQHQLAVRAGVGQQTISDLEKGKRLNISLHVICAVCHQLNLELRPVPWFYLPLLDDRLAE